MTTSPIYIALGANLPLGNVSPRQTLNAALEALAVRDIELVARSSDWHSPAWPDPSEPPYVNAVAEVTTGLSARTLLDALHAVETQFGRVRNLRWEPRVLDLDLVDFRGEIHTDRDGLIVPHPRATQRGFVLLPLQEIAPTWCDPKSGRVIDALIGALPADQTAGLYPLQSRSLETVQGLA
jgi:2-amino-4-hydroxy-6-hydroxymethyldihydropteridine diphosphokinase